MTFLYLLPSFLSGLLLGAHFLRIGNMPLLIFSILFPALIFIRRKWAKVAVQVYLLFGVFVWVLVTWRIAQDRIAFGVPWGRMAAILGTVAALNLAAAFLLQSKKLKKWFRLQ
jgi:hypothetical protein